jgi:FAD/FMN-containing dehydrogenase
VVARAWAAARPVGFDVLAGLKDRLDPNGVSNPGKLAAPA